MPSEPRAVPVLRPDNRVAYCCSTFSPPVLGPKSSLRSAGCWNQCKRGPERGQSQIIANVSLRKLYARTGKLLLVRRSFSVETSHDRTRGCICESIDRAKPQRAGNLCLRCV